MILCKVPWRVHDFLPLCEYWCMAGYVLYEKRMLHISQIYHFSLVYMRLCRATFDWRVFFFFNTDVTSICLLASIRTTMSSKIKYYKQNLCCIYNKHMAYHLCVFCISPFHKNFAGHITITNITSVGILTCMGTPMVNISPLFLNRL